ncbi:MAG: hypothetical protein HC786_29715 [Richelia sp. CSU_2_1]|nr:hypothetical protein [Microcoleus sp. SM1_3_4]NJR25988.1 hypothetical protein [Richelia sp. CSU_2_1]
MAWQFDFRQNHVAEGRRKREEATGDRQQATGKREEATGNRQQGRRKSFELPVARELRVD